MKFVIIKNNIPRDYEVKIHPETTRTIKLVVGRTVTVVSFATTAYILYKAFGRR
jgi:hypothetical protein